MIINQLKRHHCITGSLTLHSAGGPHRLLIIFVPSFLSIKPKPDNMKFDNSTIPLRRTSRWRQALGGLALGALLALPSMAQTVTIGSGTSTQRWPLGSYWGYERSASLYTAAEMSAVAGSNITTVSWYCAATGPARPIAIYLKTGVASPLTAVTWASMTAGATQVYTGSLTPSIGWNIINLPTAFSYTGQNLTVLVESNYGGGGSGSSTAPSAQYSTSTGNHAYWYADNTPPTSTATLTANRPNVQLGYSGGAPCSGTPAPGNTTGPTAVSSGDVVNLGLQNTTLGSGVTYQWYVSTTSAGAGFSPVGTGFATYSQTQTVQSWYYATVTCGGNTGTSAVKQVNMTYCTPTVTYTGDYISNFSTTGGVTNINNPSGAASPGNYGNFTGLAVSAADATSFNFTTTYVGGSNGVRIWVDWNNNLTFEPGESAFFLADGNATKTGTVTVPGSTPPGPYRMRVRAQYGSAVDPPPCGEVTYGETEDYTINVFANTACVGTPSPGNTTGPASVSSGETVNLGLQNPTLGSGVTYQWHVSTVSSTGPWTDGGTASTYSLIQTVQSWYYADVTCSGNTGSSAVKQVDMTYCAATNTSSTAYYISNFTTTGGITNITNPSGFSPTGYGDFTAQSVSQSAGVAVNFTRTFVGGTSGFAIWIDLNNDLDFADAGELVYNAATYAVSPLSASFTAPNGTPQGSYRMRVRGDYLSTSPSACGVFAYAETEDYTFTVAPPPTCPAPYALTATNATTSGADLGWTENGIANQWDLQIGVSGFTPSGIPTVENSGFGYTYAGGVPSTAYQFYVRADCSGDNVDVSTWSGPFTFNTACGAVDVPYYQNFETAVLPAFPNCMSVEDLNAATTWITATSTYVGPSSKAARYSYSGTTVANDWFYTPGINMTGGTSYILSYTYGSAGYDEALEVYYGTSPSAVAMTNLVANHPSFTSGPFTVTYTVTPAATGVYNFGWHAYSDADMFWLDVDNISVTVAPLCTATVSVADNCAAQTYVATVTGTDITGGTGTIQWTIDGVAQADVPYTAPSTPLPAVSVLSEVGITLVTPLGCTKNLGVYSSACLVELDCAATSPLPFEHCYSTGDARTWYFQTPEVGGKIDLKFTAGTLLAGDQIKIWDGAPNASTVIYTIAGTGGAIANTVYTGTVSGYMGVSIVTNASGSCQESSGTPWEFYVRCSGCVEPDGFVTVDSPSDPEAIVNCTTGTFEVVVGINSTGIDKLTGTPPATVGISYKVDGGPRIFFGYAAEFTYNSLGTAFTIGQSVEVTLEHEDQVNNSACNAIIGVGTLPLSRCPPANDLCANAITIPVGAPGSCPAGGVSGSTFGADMNGAQPSCATGPVQDVWYYMDINGFAQPMMSVTAAAGSVGIEVYSACGTLWTSTLYPAGVCNNNVLALTQPFTFNIPQGQYYLRFYTPVGGDAQFTVCVTAEQEGYECDGAINIPSAPVTNQSLVCSALPIPGLLNATNVPDVCGSATNSYKGGSEALYTFTPSVSGNYAVSYAGVSWNAIFVYADACPTNGGTCMGSVGSSGTSNSLLVAMNAGTTYYVWFDTWPTPNSPCPGTFSLFLVPPAPANDDCAGAISLDASTLTCTPTDGQTGSATQSFAGCSGTANDDVWYSFLATETSHVIRVNGYGAFDPVFQLFDGGVEPGVCPTAGPGIVCQDATAGGGLETFTAVGLSIGNRYYVRVYDYGTSVSYSTAPSFNICVTKVPTCLAPTAQAATGVTTGTAFANWTPNAGGSGSNFIVEYGPAATFTTPGTGLTAGPNGTVILNAVTPRSLGALASNTQYRYFVRQNCSATAEGFSFNSNGIVFTTLALPPANDECAGAVTLSGTNTTCVNTAGTVAGATQSPSQAGCVGTANDDVWYKFVAAGENYSITVVGADLVHQLFSGTCGALTSVACSDPQVMTVTGLTIGATYYVRVYGYYSGVASPTAFNICVVKNSDCLPPATITTTNITSSSADIAVDGSPTANYILEYGLSSNFTTPGTGATAAANGTVIAFTGNLQQISGLALTTNYRYFVRRDCGTGIYSANSTARTFLTLGAPPANDLCANAVTVTCGGTFTGTNVNATTDSAPVAVTTGQQIMTNGVWYKFVGNNQSVTLSTCNSSFDTRIHVYTGTCASPVVIAGNEDDDDGCTIFTSKVTFNAILGTTYLIAIDGYGSYSTGSISLNVTCGALCLAASNDDCANAEVLTVSPIGFCNSVTGTTACALPGVGIPNPSCASSPFDSYPDVYYTFTAAGTSHPIQVNELTGTLEFWSLNELSCGGQEDFCSYTFGSLVSVTGLTSGAVYSLRIGSVGDATFDVCIGAPTCSQDVTVEWQLGATANVPAWEMRQIGTNVVVASGGGFNAGAPFAVYPETACLPEGKFYFDMLTNLDAGGGYKVRLGQAPFTRLIDNTVAVGSNSITELTAVPAVLGTNGALQIPVGPNELLYSSCDKYFWAAGEYIVVNEDPAVAATWIVGQGDAAQSSTSGYDFWFYNPDGGYSYVRQRRNNVSDNFGNVGSARTCHMKVNNWAAANHIPNGAQLNVRVRAVVNNVPKNWGPACRFVRDEALAACTPTKLFDIPGNFAYSCNVFRAFNTATANRLYARPVGGATKYRFHVYNGETDITLERTVYYLTLGWAASVAAPLADEAVYDVTVQAFVGGVWCPVGDVCTVQICNTPASCTNDIAGGQQNSVLDTDAAFRMWPNPNNGAQLNVNLSGVEEGTSTVSMDVFDLSGKRIIARTLAVQGGFVSQVVDLNGEISTGMYMVKVTAGDQVYTERLVIQK